jgi:FixJ family two-component response regulator
MSMARSGPVAVVDDDINTLRAISRLLRVCGIETSSFASAEEFLDSGVAGGTTCVVIDIYLTGMSGIELRLRLSALNPSLPVIFMTGADDEAIRREALAAGCVAFLRKPVEGHMLLDAIKQAR